MSYQHPSHNKTSKDSYRPLFSRKPQVFNTTVHKCLSMEYLAYLIVLHATAAKFCGKTKAPFELGQWHGHLKHLDSATIENNPVSVGEGQFYVYENTFPRHTIRYINVDNVAQKTCGASATLKRGGVGTSSVLLILHAESNNEIRTVIDVWGTQDKGKCPEKKPLKREGELKNMKSRYLFMEARAVNHNTRYESGSE